MAKNKKSALPKKIAGVKVPKTIRKGQVGAFLTSPAGQKLVAEAILALGAIAGARKAAKSETAKDLAGAAREKMSEAKEGAANMVSGEAGPIAYAVGEAVRSFTEAVRRHHGDAGRIEAESHSPAESKKKPISYEAGPH